MATKTMNKTTSSRSTKTTTKKSTTPKKTVAPVVEEEMNVEDIPIGDPIEDEFEEVVEPERDEPIVCHSIYPGTIIFTGEKLSYTFEGMGSKRRILYGDLIDGLLTSKDCITAPYIIIDDERVLSLEMWQEVSKLYEDLYSISELKDLLYKSSASVFAREFPKLTIPAQNVIKSLVATGIDDGTFDSLNKINIVDEVCKTDLKVLIK